MITIPFAHSELTGKLEVCTVCPELRSEIDGKLIVDGTPDCDLLALHEFSFCNIDGMIPSALYLDRHGNPKKGSEVVLQASDKFCKKIARRQREQLETTNEAATKAASMERIQAYQAHWNDLPKEDELQQLIFDESKLVIGLMRLYQKIE